MDAGEKAMGLLIGEHLRKLRVACGLTVSAAAKACEMNRATVSYIERGRGVPTFSVVFKMARAYGTTLADIGAVVDAEFDYKPSDYGSRERKVFAGRLAVSKLCVESLSDEQIDALITLIGSEAA